MTRRQNSKWQKLAAISFIHSLARAPARAPIGRSDNEEIRAICAKINHESTWRLARAERAFLSFLDASCDTPMSAYAVYQENQIIANYMLANFEGSKIEYCRKISTISNAEEDGVAAAKELRRLFS